MKTGTLLVLATFALSASAAASELSPAPVRTLTVEIPRSSIQEQGVASDEATATRSSRVEVIAGTWAPRDFQGFSPRSIPFLGLARSSSLLSRSSWSLHSRLALGVRTMEREESYQFADVGSPLKAMQSLYLIPVSAGFEVRKSLASSALQPFAGAALVPTAAFYPRSTLRTGSMNLGVTFEGSLGMRVADAGISGTVTLGHIQGSSAFGWGVQLFYGIL